MEQNKIFFESDSKNPEIKFNDGLLSISGNSIGVSPELYFYPLIDWVKSFSGETLCIEIDLNKINCSSVKLLMKALVIADLNKNIKKKSITWFFKDMEEQELGDMVYSNLKHTNFKLYCKN